MKRFLLKSITLLLFLPFLSTITKAQLLDRIIAKVDNFIVLQSEFELAFEQFRTNMEGKVNENEIQCKVLETLIINKLLLAKAEIDSVTVDRSAVDDQLERRMQYFVAQVGGADKLEQYYGKSLNDLKADLRKQVKEQMITQKMQESITSKTKVNPGDVKKFYNSIPYDSLPYLSTEVEIGQIVKKAFISKSQKGYARKKLEEIRQRIINGEDFCELAKIYSEDPGSGKLCGELGFFKKGDLVPPYESAALKLKPGETSAIVESEFGYHIIQLLGRKGNEYDSRHILIKAASSKQDISASAEYLDSLREEILKGKISFQKAAKEYSDDKTTGQNGGMFQDANTNDSKIALENINPDLFFIIDTMKIGSITHAVPMQMEDGTEAVRIVYYKSKIAPHKANLKDDYQKIVTATQEEKKNNAINQWFDKTKGEVFIDINSDYKDCQILKAQ
ncbi:MAG TPA: peptidylprolyl isomerase [Cytophagaceae bacterium]|jgi:peptidyl-prolyl cis-trans isomerase SurA|nr:peptidylprolyl isomerase [Cytophagaceae bacterium]